MLPIDADIQDLEKNKTVEEKTVDKQSIQHHLAFSKAGILSAIVKIPPKDTSPKTYQELPRTIEDEDKIDDLITTMGVNGKLTLLLHHERRLRQMGLELKSVHPLKFTGYIFSKPELKKHMATIFDDYFKRTNFVKDYSQELDIFDLRNLLVIYLDDFAKEVGIPKEQLQPFFNNRDWEGFLRFLISY